MTSDAIPDPASASPGGAGDTGVAELDAKLTELVAEAGIESQHGLVKRILTAGIGLGQDSTTRLDLKITAAAVEELRAAFKLFAPYRGIPKVTIFGSARTRRHDPLWLNAEAAARGLGELGWMTVTGAGPGIMEAAATGAGPEGSLGVSIRLPFEETSVSGSGDSDRRVEMRYFFTRKLMLVKESSGFICLPGGFGTMDETFELLTLQQTGKMEPMPIVLLDRVGGTYWKGFARFVTEELAGAGLVSVTDLDRVVVTDSPDAAIEAVTGFWRNYDSLRWSGDRLVMRLRTEPSDAELAELNERFSGLCASGIIERTAPLPEEVSGKDRLDLPRIVFTPRRPAVGDLYRLIGALNELASAP